MLEEFLKNILGNGLYTSLEYNTLPNFIKGYYQVKKEYDDKFKDK